MCAGRPAPGCRRPPRRRRPRTRASRPPCRAGPSGSWSGSRRGARSSRPECCTARWFLRIHWAAAITSLVRAMPWSSITSSETIPAVGAAPAWFGAEPAARPATSVPWPLPSPGELFSSEVMSSCASTRPPKSRRLESMPESTKAIAGVGSGLFVRVACRLARPGQSWSTPTAAGQSSPELNGAGGGVRVPLRVLGLRVGLRVEHDRLVGRDHEPGFVASFGRSPATISPAAASTMSQAWCSRSRSC